MVDFAPSSEQTGPPDWLRDSVASLTGRDPQDWKPPDTGLMPTHRYLVSFDHGPRVFVKAAMTEETAALLRIEERVMRAVGPRFAPSVIAWHDQAGEMPILIAEALDDAYWPASHRGTFWREGDFDLVFAALRELPDVNIGGVDLRESSPVTPFWPAILDAQKEFLELRICSPSWLASAGPILAAEEAKHSRVGPFLVHGDIRSDNICIRGGRAMFVDWGNARRGTAEEDLANLLAGLHMEGGPPPAEVMPAGGQWAAWGAADIYRFFVERPDAPAWLRRVMVKMLAIQLEWASTCLGLPPRDGTRWRDL